ncbi:MAG: biopolymer transporter ExbD [bacterium]
MPAGGVCPAASVKSVTVTGVVFVERRAVAMVSGLGKHKSETVEEIEIDLVPIMNTFLVLVPFLLLSAAFFHLKAIDTSVPVLADTQKDGQAAGPQEVKVTAVMEIKEKEILLSAISDSLGTEELSTWDTQIAKKGKEAEYPYQKVLVHLRKLKVRYPASDTLIIIPDGSILYDTIVQAMDAARYSDEKPLFPRVVLSGKVS